MEYELVYTHEANKGNTLIGAQIESVFVPKKPSESEELFLTRLRSWMRAVQPGSNEPNPALISKGKEAIHVQQTCNRRSA